MKNNLGVKNKLVRFVVGLAVVGGGVVLATPSSAATVTVDLTAANTLDPATLTINEGDTVDFNWVGGFHDVTFDDGTISGAPEGGAGVNYSRTFATAGAFPYICSIHPTTMIGEITVQAAATTTAAPTTAAPTTAAPTTAAPTTAAVTVPASGLPATGTSSTVLLFSALALVMGGFVALRLVRRPV